MKVPLTIGKIYSSVVSSAPEAVLDSADKWKRSDSDFVYINPNSLLCVAVDPEHGMGIFLAGHQLVIMTFTLTDHDDLLTSFAK
jgi:hypothetical protein